jgi:hypothetical protein
MARMAVDFALQPLGEDSVGSLGSVQGVTAEPVTIVKERLLKVEKNSLVVEATMSNGRKMIYGVPRFARAEAESVDTK